MINLLAYFKETRAELTHVNWPTRRQAVIFTVIVIGLSIMVGVLLGGFDYLYTSLIKLVI